MKRKDNVIELFPRKKESVVHHTKWEQEQEEKRDILNLSPDELEEVEEGISEIVEEMEKKTREESGLEIIPKASVMDWLVENCNELPVYEQEDGQKNVIVPYDVLNEMVSILQDSVNEQEIMVSALVRIGYGENDMASKIARNALDKINKEIDTP